jgi:hypothetical protein
LLIHETAITNFVPGAWGDLSLARNGRVDADLRRDGAPTVVPFVVSEARLEVSTSSAMSDALAV